MDRPSPILGCDHRTVTRRQPSQPPAGALVDSHFRLSILTGAARYPREAAGQRSETPKSGDGARRVCTTSSRRGWPRLDDRSVRFGGGLDRASEPDAVEEGVAHLPPGVPPSREMGSVTRLERWGARSGGDETRLQAINGIDQEPVRSSSPATRRVVRSTPPSARASFQLENARLHDVRISAARSQDARSERDEDVNPLFWREKLIAFSPCGHTRARTSERPTS